MAHLTDDEEDDSHGGTKQSDQHEELEPENQTLKRRMKEELVTKWLQKSDRCKHNSDN